MKKLLCFVIFIIVFMGLTTGSHAAMFLFEGTDMGGTGSATMDISVSGNRLIVVVNNVSPTVLDDGTGYNAPGITAFGFDLVGAGTINCASWTLKAYDTAGGSLNPVADGYWGLAEGSNTNGITVDYAVYTTNGSKGALYHPDVAGWESEDDFLGGPPHYFTEAMLLIEFDGEPILDFSGDWSPFIRMQNVGLNGEGSLKLTHAPIPSAFFLLGSGLIGLVGFGRKLKRQ